MQEIQVSAKTEEKAIEEAVRRLNVSSADELNIEVVEKAAKGLSLIHILKSLSFFYKA